MCGYSYSLELNDLLTFQITLDNRICKDFRNDLLRVREMSVDTVSKFRSLGGFRSKHLLWGNTRSTLGHGLFGFSMFTWCVASTSHSEICVYL